MRADDHTRSMLGWWEKAGVAQVDLAVRRTSGAMIWHLDQRLGSLPLGWARAENVRGAEVYARPARGYLWPMVFLDDVPAPKAVRVARRYDALVVQTSTVGGCHVWLSCAVPLGEEDRRQVQSWLAARLGADPGSTSGEHLGRLAGFKNWKRGGTWVNVVDARHGKAVFEPRLEEVLRPPGRLRAAVPTSADASPGEGVDSSESGREWGWTCGMLEAGCDPHSVYSRLLDRARVRRGGDADRYALRTVSRAIESIAQTDR
jgi:hypothetical protein